MQYIEYSTIYAICFLVKLLIYKNFNAFHEKYKTRCIVHYNLYFKTL